MIDAGTRAIFGDGIGALVINVWIGAVLINVWIGAQLINVGTGAVLISDRLWIVFSAIWCSTDRC